MGRSKKVTLAVEWRGCANLGRRDRVSQQIVQYEPNPKHKSPWEAGAFCAYPHDGDKWHGFPVGWKEVPEALRREWKAAGLVKQTDIRRFWESSEDAP